MYRLIGTALAVCVVFALSACGGRPTSAGPATRPGPAIAHSQAAAAQDEDSDPSSPGAVPVRVAAQSAAVPPFAPDLTGIALGATGSTAPDFDFTGVNFAVSESRKLVASEGLAVMSPQGSNQAWDTLAAAVYHLHLGDYAVSGKPQTLKLQWDAERQPDRAQLWVGLAEAASGRWQWYAGPEDDVLTLASFAPYTNAAGDVTVVVVLGGLLPAALERIQLGAPELRGMGALVSKGGSNVSPTTVKAASSLPASYDLSAACSPITNQGSVGACTAFTVGNGAMNYELNRIYGAIGWDFADDYNLVSQKYLYAVTGAQQGLGCPDDGRYLGACVSYLVTPGNGIASYHNAPYIDVCNYNFSQDALDDAAVLRAEGYESIETLKPGCLDILRTLLAVYERPVIIGLNVDSAFQWYSPDSVWDYSGPPVGGHAVLVVGYDDAKGAFKIRNSWGTAWGNGGYGWIGYSTFATNRGTWIEAYCMWAEYDPAVQERFLPDAGLIPPTDLVASDGVYDNHVQITWNAAENATGYTVYRADASNGAFAEIGSSTTTSFTDTAVPDSDIYWYRIASTNAEGESSRGPAEAGNLALGAPAAVAATDGAHTNRVRVTWNAVPNAAAYRVYRATSQTGSYSLISSSGATFYDDPQPTTATFWYKVSAYNVQGESSQSIADGGHAGLAAPLGVAATDASFTDHVHITWAAPAGAVSYKLYRAGSPSGTYMLIASPDEPSYDDAVSVATPLWYRVRAVNAAGESLDSAAESGHAELAAPIGLSATDGTLTDRVHLAWSGTGSGYKIFRASSATGIFSEIGVSSTNQYDDYRDDTAQYWYQVRATNANGDSQPSNTNTGNAALAAPGSFDASDASFSDHVHLSWDAVPGATGYNIFRAGSETGSYLLLTKVSGTQWDDFTGFDTVYWYKVKASNASGLSTPSAADAGQAGLAAPKDLGATNASLTDRVRLDWKAMPNATGYRVFRADAPSSSFSEIGTTTKLVYDDPRLTTALAFYKVRSIGESGDSWFSAQVSGRASLAAPVGLVATDGTFSDHVHLSWGGVAGAKQYLLYRSATANGSYQLLATLSGNHYDDFMPWAYPYFYRVKASNGSGQSQPCMADEGRVGVGAPWNVMATDGTLKGRIRITWDKVPNALKYKIYRWNGTTWEAVAGITAAQYEDTVPDGKLRYYRVIATGPTGDSLPSRYDTGYAGT